MIKAGLTGGIGSGKTTIAKAFEALGVPVFNADEETKKFLGVPQVQAQLVALLGSDIVGAEGKLDKSKIASVVFRDEKKLLGLNAILHPLAKESFLKWCEQHAEAPYVIKEAAILFESGAWQEVDKVIAVTCSEATRIKRVVERDNVSAEEVKARIQRQLPDEVRNKKAQFVIQNDGEMVLPQVLRIHGELMLLAKKK